MKSLKIQLPGTPEKESTTIVPVKKTGGLLSLNIHDLIQGAIMAAIGAGGTIVQQALEKGITHMDWKTIGGVSAAAGIGYLLKNLGQPSQVIIKAKDLE